MALKRTGGDLKILAVDQGTKTGFYTGTISGVNVFDVKRGESPGMRFLRFKHWLNEIYGLMGGIDVIVYEQAHHRGGAATQVAVGMVTHMLSFAAEKDIEIYPVHSGTLKKYATGKGNAGKDEMIRAAIDRGFNPRDDNEADAVLLWKYAVDHLVVLKNGGK